MSPRAPTAMVKAMLPAFTPSSMVTLPGEASSHFGLSDSIQEGQTAPSNDTIVSSISAGQAGAFQPPDDSAILQAAVNAASSVDGTVWLQPGTYGVGETLKIPSNVTVTAASGTVTLQALPGVQTMLGIAGSVNNGTANPVKNVSISNITIDGNSLNVGNASPLVVSWIAQDVSFVNDIIENSRGIGALVSNSSSCYFCGDTLNNIGNYASITGSLSDCAQGIAFCDSSTFSSQGNRVIGCSFGQIGLDAVSATQQTNFVVTQCAFSDLNTLQGWQDQPQGAAGVYLDDDTGSLLLGDTISGASGNGLDIANCDTVYVRDCHVTSNYESGICAAGVNILAVTNTTSNNNNVLNGHYPHTAGLTITGGDSGAVSNVTISNDQFQNIGTDPTQYYGIQVDPGTCVTNLTTGDLSLSGNTMAPSNSPLFGYSGTSDQTVNSATKAALTVLMTSPEVSPATIPYPNVTPLAASMSSGSVDGGAAASRPQQQEFSAPTKSSYSFSDINASNTAPPASQRSSAISTDVVNRSRPFFIAAAPTTTADAMVQFDLASPLDLTNAPEGLTANAAFPFSVGAYPTTEVPICSQSIGDGSILSMQIPDASFISSSCVGHGAASGAAAGL